MKKLCFAKRAFVLLIILLLSIPSLPFWSRGGKIKPPLLEGFETGKYQEVFTAWFYDNFHWRVDFIRFKSSLFYLVNFKRFFLPSNIRLISYANRIVDSRDHNSYKILVDNHRAAYGDSAAEIESMKLTVEKLKSVQQAIDNQGKKFLCISAASGWEEVYGDKVSAYYKFFEDYCKNSADEISATFNALLKSSDINYFNTRTFLDSKARSGGIDTVSFFDSHWNRYGAGLVAIETLKDLKTIYKTDWEIPQIEAIEISSGTDLEEIRALRANNLFRPLENAFLQKRLAFPYIVYKTPTKERQIKLITIGDSFSEQYTNQILASKFTPEQNITQYSNRESEVYDNLSKVIEANEIIIIVFSGSNFYGARFKNLVDMFYDYLVEGNPPSHFAPKAG